jgi:hypothetical protein
LSRFVAFTFCLTNVNLYAIIENVNQLLQHHKLLYFMSEQPKLPYTEAESSQETNPLVLASSVDFSIVKNTLTTASELSDLRANSKVDLLHLAKLANPDLNTDLILKESEAQARLETNFKDNGEFPIIGGLSAFGLGVLGAIAFYPNQQNQGLGFFGGVVAGSAIGIIGAKQNQERYAKRKYELAQDKATAQLLALESKRLNGNTPTIEIQIHKLRDKETL